jgi:hypothetical protein
MLVGRQIRNQLVSIDMPSPNQLLLVLFMLILISCHENKRAQQPQRIRAPQQVRKEVVAICGQSGATVIDPIVAIRKKVERINTIQLQQRHIEFQCDEKTKVDRYYNGKQIVKIVVDYGTIGDVYAREEYYYDAGKLLFVYEFVEGGPACEGCIKKNEYRSYVKNDKVIKYLKDTKKVACRRCEFGPKSKPYRLLKGKTQEEVKAILCS